MSGRSLSETWGASEGRRRLRRTHWSLVMAPRKDSSAVVQAGGYEGLEESFRAG